MGNFFGNFPEIFEGDVDFAIICNGRNVQGRIGGSAQGHVRGNSIVKGFLQ